MSHEGVSCSGRRVASEAAKTVAQDTVGSRNDELSFQKPAPMYSSEVMVRISPLQLGTTTSDRQRIRAPRSTRSICRTQMHMLHMNGACTIYIASRAEMAHESVNLVGFANVTTSSTACTLSQCG